MALAGCGNYASREIVSPIQSIAGHTYVIQSYRPGHRLSGSVIRLSTTESVTKDAVTDQRTGHSCEVTEKVDVTLCLQTQLARNQCTRLKCQQLTR